MHQGQAERISLPGLRYDGFTPELRRGEDGVEIRCQARREWFALTPEEWVRQSLLHHLAHDLGYPLGLISLEHPVRVNGMPQRADLVVMDRQLQPFLLVECKAPRIELGLDVLEQVSRYNHTLGARFIAITNGLRTAVYARGEDGYQHTGEEIPPWERPGR